MNGCRARFAVVLLCGVACTLAAADRELGFYRSKGLYVQGVRHCRELLEAATTPDERQRVLFELAACYQFNTRDHTYREAVETYDTLIHADASDPRCAKAFFNIGRCYDVATMNRAQDIAKAREAYTVCYEKYPRSQWADQAYFWNANSYIYTLTPKTAATAVGLFEQFLKRYPDSGLTGVVHSQLSELYCAWLNNYDLAVRHSEAALEYGIQDIKLKQLHLYRLGYLYQFKLGKPEQALSWYRRLMAASPMKSDPNYFVAQKRIRELQGDAGDEP